MERQRVVITGARGMLGSALVAVAPPQYEATGVDLEDGDITQTFGARQAIAQHDPVAVIHCAAYTDVEGCTRDPKTAFEVNAKGTANVAIVCHECECLLIALSTDYVFDGKKRAAYLETDEPNPLNAYGESKLQGERFARESHDRLLIARTQWLYGPGGRNFLSTIVNKGREQGSLKVVSDEFGSPTYTMDLARRLWELVALEPTGIVHCVNSGVCSWADLAKVALTAAGESGVEVQRISRSEWKSDTVRPAYSPLQSAREAELGLSPLRPWDEAATQYAGEYLHR